MKNIFTLILILTAATSANADVIKAIRTNSGWNSSSTWDKNRRPVSNDTVVIGLGYKIILTNTQTLSDVLIKISGTLELDGGKLDLSSNSEVDVFTGGRIIGDDGDDQIRIGNTHVFKGNLPDVIGPKYASIATGGGFLTLSLLPVTFVNFYVGHYNNDVRLNWATANETENNHFEIERSFDGANWTTIGMVLGAINSATTTSYSFTDKNVKASVVYYRIKQVDNNGQFTYTSIKSVKNTETKSNTQIYASGKSIVVKFDQLKENVTVKVMNMNGQVINQQTIGQSGTVFTVSSNVKQNGLYVVQVIDSANNFDSKKVMLN
ncbi:MAG TPA: T9SS type A sorting domain-containing protein [Chitinophagaceae bacterium]|nr:T9SS type A sorting domain-containing protein [Chitinophagaceae bacterium]